MNIKNLTNNNRIITSQLGNFSVLEYGADLSLSPATAQTGFFMSKMGVRRRQVIIEMKGNNSAVLQAGAMQWMLGDIKAATNVKGVGDFVGKMFKGAVTKESAVKPEYTGVGTLALEPTYKYIILQDVSQWGGGMVIETVFGIPGVGKKTAQKLMLAMRGKLVMDEEISAAPAGNPKFADIVNALSDMGFDYKKAHKAVEEVAKSSDIMNMKDDEREKEIFKRAIVLLST